MRSVGKDKKGKMQQHFPSESHKIALSDLAHFACNMKNVDVMLEKKLREVRIQEEENNLRNQEAIKILLDIARTLARQQLAFRGLNEKHEGNFIQISNLVARHNPRLQQHLQEMVGRNIPYIPCQGHRSCKRDSMLQEHMEKIENALKLRNLSKTRWVYRSESIEAVWRSFEAIRNALAEIAKIDNNSLTRTKATSLCKKMVKFEFVFAVMFMRFIMRKTKILTVQMQKPELNILDGLQLIDETVRSLERIRHNESELNDQIDASVEFAKTLSSNP
ncbi:uncharacterized protein LOC124437305 isoform X2 [Xenia sp. Carnegie-2017]|uniref:uncharacterized protein LOC124437305 isoform X2 n=1 Tax=Xenia sp. Carnegie-2017 TaxID=2897299 RepID=UPI001F040C84|nr:uncharacterized protein LOC124437305 isoform X2 [Xenia sp. Carnegie-2017]